MRVYEITSIIVVNEDSETPNPKDWDIQTVFENSLDIKLHDYAIRDLAVKYLKLH